MDIVDKLIQEWSWRTNKGYPDIDSDTDLDILREVLGEDLYEATFKQLSFGDLKKYGGPRLKVLYDKIQKQEAFLTGTDEEVVLDFAKEEYADLFANQDISGITALTNNRPNNFPFFVGKDGDSYTISSLVKAPEFGGKGQGSGTTKEDMALAGINDALTDLGAIDVRISPEGELYEGIVKASTVPGTPKADFTLDNTQGPVIFISHKDGSKPSDFQQYGGFTGLMDEPEIKSFIEAVGNATNGELEPKQSFMRKLEGDSIKLKAIYGLDQEQDSFSNNKCQVVYQGPVKFIKQNDSTYLITSNHTLINPELPTEGYEPILYVSYRKGRNSGGLRNCRFGIYPSAKAASTVTEI
jgi:hypothetical protein